MRISCPVMGPPVPGRDRMENAAPAPLVGATHDPRAAELLDAFARGDERAFAQLVDEHQSAALDHAARIVGDAETARDVVQEAFLRILRHHLRYDRKRSFRAWLLAIVRNLAIDALRRRRHGSDPGELAARGAPLSANLEAIELRERVASVLSELPEKYRTILAMRELEGIPAEDIAAETGVDYGTTRWRLHQARRLFRERWLARFGQES